MPQAPLSDSQLTEIPASASNVDVAASQDVTISEDYNDLGVHFSTAINAGWQKLEQYYSQSDVTPIHRAAVLLHPRLKWRWFERYWRTKPDWIADAREAIAELWSQYKDQPVNTSSPAAEPTIP